MISSASASTLRRRTNPRFTRPCWKAVSSALSARLISGTAPCPSRSAGTKAWPARRRASGARCAPAQPPRRMRSAWARGRRTSPLSRASNSSWPLPATPAIPRISPLRTSRSRPVKDTPKGSGLRQCRSRTWRKGAPPVAFGYSAARPSASPTISRASSRSEHCAGTHCPATRPPRSTVARWQSARTSASLWLMKRTLQPSSARRRRVTKRSSASRGVSTEVGSSRISRRMSCIRQRTISTRWRSPMDSPWTSRRGSSGMP
ncbi:hypothetical protein PAERUG_E16_London_17_VIM_2_04_14_00309 [Pseudomonas aeruginosa]|nr:hypothetical protein PAERUG_E16_London_17_VIM_2_04_14_00309 [Pseudomonas aeruginosa]